MTLPHKPFQSFTGDECDNGKYFVTEKVMEKNFSM
jgi:hypothetical protein